MPSDSIPGSWSSETGVGRGGRPSRRVPPANGNGTQPYVEDWFDEPVDADPYSRDLRSGGYPPSAPYEPDPYEVERRQQPYPPREPPATGKRYVTGERYSNRDPYADRGLFADSDPRGGGEPYPPPERNSHRYPTGAGYDPGDPRFGEPTLPVSRVSFDSEPDDEPAYDDYFDDDEDIELEDVTSGVTRNILEWAVVLVGAVLVALVLRASLFQAFFIPSESMETTLLIDDRVLVNKLSYRLHDINRGDIVVFVRPDEEPNEIRDLIKRVIGLPGDTVEAHDNTIYINGNRLIEPYLDADAITLDFGPEIVPEGHVFVMGDNRDESLDSRVFGPIDEDRVVGRAFVLFWPLNRLGSL